MMFYGCKSLSNIKPLENWNVGNGNKFSYMFGNCTSMSDIKPLENWDVSNGRSFNGMLTDCYSLTDIKLLKIGMLVEAIFWVICS